MISDRIESGTNSGFFVFWNSSKNSYFLIVKSIKFDYFGFISNLFHLDFSIEKYDFFEENQKITNPEIVPNSNRSEIFFEIMKNHPNESETRFGVGCVVSSRFNDLNTVRGNSPPAAHWKILGATLRDHIVPQCNAKCTGPAWAPAHLSSTLNRSEFVGHIYESHLRSIDRPLSSKYFGEPSISVAVGDVNGLIVNAVGRLVWRLDDLCTVQILRLWYWKWWFSKAIWSWEGARLISDGFHVCAHRIPNDWACCWRAQAPALARYILCNTAVTYGST